MLKWIRGSKPFQLTEADKARAEVLYESIDKTFKFGDKSVIGLGYLTAENVKLLSAQNKLSFWDMEGRKVKALDLDTTVSRMETFDGTILFRVERDDASTIGRKVLETLRYVGVKEVEVSIFETRSLRREGDLKVGALSALTLEASGSHDLNLSSIFSVRGSTPDNIVPSRDRIDHQFICKYGLDQFVRETCDSYDAFTSGKLNSLTARPEVRKIDLVLETTATGKASLETDCGVHVSASAGKKKLIEAKLEFTVTFLSDKHPGLLAKRKEEETKRRNEEDKKKANEKLAEEESRKMEAEKEFNAMEAQCKDDLDTAAAGYRMEMNNALEFLADSSSWSGLWNGDEAPAEKKIFVVGVRESGKSTLVWLMSTLAGHNWEAMDMDGYAKATRRPLGAAEASIAVTRVPLTMLQPSRQVATLAVDIQGERHQVRGYTSDALNQSIVVVVPAARLFKPDGELANEFNKTLNLLPYINDAAAIVITKWDELKYGVASRSGDLYTNVDQFWSNPNCVAFSKECVEKLQNKTKAKVFGFRMPIRGEGSKRTYQARYQMCCGVKELLLFLINNII